MLVMTAKVDKRKIIILFTALLAAIGIIAAVFWGAGSDKPATTPAPSTEPVPTDEIAQSTAHTDGSAADTNDARVRFLTDLGWDVTVSPTESMQVKIPQDTSEVFQRYNALQKTQGFDLSKYAGKTVMRYVYRVNNFPDATEPVYATVLVYKDQIIGGDITNTAPDGKVQGFVKENASQP